MCPLQFVYLRYAFLHILCNSNPSCAQQSVCFLYACVCDIRDILHIRKKLCLCTLVREYVSLLSYIWINESLTSVLYRLMRCMRKYSCVHRPFISVGMNYLKAYLHTPSLNTHTHTLWITQIGLCSSRGVARGNALFVTNHK